MDMPVAISAAKPPCVLRKCSTKRCTPSKAASPRTTANVPSCSTNIVPDLRYGRRATAQTVSAAHTGSVRARSEVDKPQSEQEFSPLHTGRRATWLALLGMGSSAMLPFSSSPANNSPAMQAQRAGAAAAADLDTAVFAGGDFRFLELEFGNLKYAGVADAVPGYLGPQGIQAVQVTYDPARIEFKALMRTYWKHCQPTQSGGQFKDVGPEYISAIQVSSEEQRAEVEKQRGQLERSGLFGAGLPLVTQVLQGLPFEPAPEDQRGTLKALRLADKKKFAKVSKERSKYFDEHFGFVQFCKDKVCGYVRFAPRCTGECEAVFPEYLETNFGQPELEGDIKITGGSTR